MQLKTLYGRMTNISERYSKLKTIFDNFCQLSTDQLTDQTCSVKGITFFPELEKNHFDVAFAGRKIRFSFLVAEDEQNALRGFVRCNLIGEDEKPSATSLLEEFSFSNTAESSINDPDGDEDPLCVDLQWAAGYIVLRFLYASFPGKKGK
jgi:hypothetical protein